MTAQPLHEQRRTQKNREHILAPNPFFRMSLRARTLMLVSPFVPPVLFRLKAAEAPDCHRQRRQCCRYYTSSTHSQQVKCYDSAAAAVDNAIVKHDATQTIKSVNTISDSLAHMLAHQLPSGYYSHPCSCQDDNML